MTTPAAALAPARRAALTELIDAAEDYARIETIRARLYGAVREAHPYLDLPLLAGLVGVTLPTVQRILDTRDHPPAEPIVPPALAELGVRVDPPTPPAPVASAVSSANDATTLGSQLAVAAYIRQLAAGGPIPGAPAAAPATRRAAGAARKRRGRR